MPAEHNYDHERELWDTYAESTRETVTETEAVFRWTQYGDHGPGTELLGEPNSVLEIGCGTGRALAYLAQQGVKATGIDLSPVMVEQTTERWGHSVSASSVPKLLHTWRATAPPMTPSIPCSGQRGSLTPHGFSRWWRNG